MSQNSTVDIRVVSIAGSPRREKMREQLDAAALDWQFFDALTGAPADIPYDPAKARRTHGRSLERGELGCFASHRALWHVAAKLSDNQVMLVMEDDLIIDPVFFRRIEEAGRAAIDYGYLRLYAKVPAGLRRKAAFLDRHVAQFSGCAYGTQAYFITAKSARRLLGSIRQVVRPVDDEMDRFWAHKIPTYAVFPAPVMEINYGTTIASKRREAAQLTFREKLARTGIRAMEKMRRHASAIIGI